VVAQCVASFASGQRYTWVLEIDLRTDVAWRMPFASGQAPLGPA
jgi:hypothetical protein